MKTSGLPFEKCTLFLCGKYIFDQNKVQKKHEVIICYHFFDLLLDQLLRNQMRDAVRLYIFAGLSGCHTVKFLVHTVKYSLVRKTDLVHDLGNGKLRGAEQTPGMGDPHLIEILQERNSHMLFEKAAEIFLAEADSGRNIVQGDFFRIMLSNIGNNHAECVIWLFLTSCGPQRGIHRKRLDQVGQHQKSDTILAHGAGDTGICGGSHKE